MKKILVVFMLLVCGIAAAVYYFYNRIAYQPDWYAGNKTGIQYQLSENAAKLEAKIKKALKKGQKVTLTADQITALVAARIETISGVKVRQIIRAVKTTIDPAGIDVEMIIDVTRLPIKKLPPDAKKILDKGFKQMPSTVLRNLYVQSRLKPLRGKKTIGLAPASSLSVGKMQFSLEKLEKLIGRKSAISLPRFPIAGFKLKENALVLLPEKGR